MQIAEKFRLQEKDAVIRYDRKLKLYDNGMVHEFTYKKQMTRIKDGIESRQDVASRSKKRESDDREIRKDNLIRSRNILFDYAFQNEKYFKTFWTLTFKENITDLELANRHFNNFIKSIRRLYPDFKYLCVPEFQKRGAVHYHLLTDLGVDSDVIVIQPGKKEMYDIKYWNHGFSSVFDLKNSDSKFNVGLYIGKYLFKDIDNRLYGRQKILKSNNLEKPSELLLSKNDLRYEYAMEYIKKKGYSISEYEHEPHNRYEIAFVSKKVKIEHEHYNTLKKELVLE